MIPVIPPPEPAEFDERCRKRGNGWLARNVDAHPHQQALWRAFLPELREGFGGRCGFSAMFVPRGTVDHWISVDSDRSLAYEWSNYRFVDGAVNSAKKPSWEGKLLDPFEVQDDWFEILLPSLQLVICADLDPATRERAEFTLEKLHLRDGEDVIRQRREWLHMYELGELKLPGLFKVAPLVARAVARRDGLALPAAAKRSGDQTG